MAHVAIDKQHLGASGEVGYDHSVEGSPEVGVVPNAGRFAGTAVAQADSIALVALSELREREGGRQGERERETEGGGERGREGGETEGGRERGREREMEGERDGGREGGWSHGNSYSHSTIDCHMYMYVQSSCEPVT